MAGALRRVRAPLFPLRPYEENIVFAILHLKSLPFLTIGSLTEVTCPQKNGSPGAGSGKKCSQEQILTESLEKLNEAWTNKALKDAQGFLETSKQLLQELEKSPEESGVDLVALRAGLQELEEEIGKVSS